MLSAGDIVTVKYNFRKDLLTNQNYGMVTKVYPHPSKEYCAYQVHWLDSGLNKVLNDLLFYSEELKKI